MNGETIKHYAKRFLAGMMIGVGGILPGVSGSVLAVAFGLYGPILDALATFFRNVKENLKLLVPVALGSAAGLYGVAVILNKVMDKYEVPLIFLFCGLIAGSMPALLREAKAASGGLKKHCFLVMAAGLALSLLLLLIEREPGGGAETVVGPLQSALTGGILTAGSILPGFSTSFILFRLGWYGPMMAAFTKLDVSLLLWAGLGALIAAVSLIGIMRMLIRRFPGPTYCLVIGLMAGSMISSLPHVPLAWGSLIYAVPFAVGALAAILMAKMEG